MLRGPGGLVSILTRRESRVRPVRESLSSAHLIVSILTRRESRVRRSIVSDWFATVEVSILTRRESRVRPAPRLSRWTK